MAPNTFQPVPPSGPGPLRQFEIYLQGFIAGVKPIVPIAFAELEAKAREKLAPEAYAYLACGAGLEHTSRKMQRLSTVGASYGASYVTLRSAISRSRFSAAS